MITPCNELGEGAWRGYGIVYCLYVRVIALGFDHFIRLECTLYFVNH